MLRHPGDAGVPCGHVEGGEVRSADPDPSGGRGDEAEEGVQERRLARPTGADECHGLPRLDGEVHVRDGVRAPPRVADRHVLEGQGTLRRNPAGPRRRQGTLQHREDVLRGGEALGRRVVLGPHLTQRQIGLGREDEHDQAVVQLHVSVDQAHADGDGDERHGQRGEQFQGEGRQESDPQGPHGRLAVLAGDALDRLCLCLGPAEDLQCRQPRDHVQEVPRQPRQQPPLPVHPGLGGPADQHHEDRDEGQGADDDGRRNPVLGDDAGQYRHGHDDREAQLRKVAREVVVEGVDTTGGEGDQ